MAFEDSTDCATDRELESGENATHNTGAVSQSRSMIASGALGTEKHCSPLGSHDDCYAEGSSPFRPPFSR